MNIFNALLYLFTFYNDKSFVFCQYPSDYFDVDNAISTNGNSYYHSKARQYENGNQDTDIGATVNLKTQLSIIKVANNISLLKAFKGKSRYF